MWLWPWLQAAQLQAARIAIPEGAGDLQVADREHLAGLHRKRLADMTRHCLNVLKPLMQHKVIPATPSYHARRSASRIPEGSEQDPIGA